MNQVTATTPAATQAAILKAVAGSAHPRLEIPNIAHHHGMSLDQLNSILKRGGYPDKQVMLRRADDLTAQATAAPDHGDDGIGRLVQVPIDQIHPDPNNVRETVGDITELADSILEAGLLQPIVVRRHNQHLYVVAGHRRLAATRHLKWTHVPCIIHETMSPDDVLAAMLIENGHRADLDPIEEARGLRRLKAQLGDVPDVAVARKVGRTPTHVGARLALLALTPEEQDQVRNGQIGVVAAAEKGRLASGRVRPASKGRPAVGHFNTIHALANRAQARCARLGHKRVKAKSVGGVACGTCWEEVIRADERDKLHAASGVAGRCVLCDTPQPAQEGATA